MRMLLGKRFFGHVLLGLEKNQENHLLNNCFILFFLNWSKITRLHSQHVIGMRKLGLFLHKTKQLGYPRAKRGNNNDNCRQGIMHLVKKTSGKLNESSMCSSVTMAPVGKKAWFNFFKGLKFSRSK